MLFLNHAINLLFIVLLWTVTTLFGRRLCRWSGWRLPTLAGRVVLASALGLAALSLGVFIVGSLGLLYRWVILGLLALFVLFGAAELPLLWRWIRGWSPPPRPTPFVTALIAVVVIEALLISVVNLAPPTSGDPQAYHLALPKYYIVRHRIEWLPHFPGASPQLVEMLYTAGMLLRSDVVSALFNMVLLFLAVAALWVVVRRYARSATVAWLAAALFFTLPSIYHYGISVKVEAAWTLYVLLAWYALLLWLDEGQHRWLVLLAVCIGLFVNTKYQALLGVASLLVAGLTGAWLRRDVLLSDHVRLRRAVLISCGLGLLLLLPWYGRNWWYGGDPLWPLGYPFLTSRYYTAEVYHKFASWERGFGTQPWQLFMGPWNLTVRTATFGTGGDFRRILSPVFLALLPGLLLAWPDLSGGVRRPIGLLLIGAAVGYLLWFYAGYQKLDYIFPVLAPLTIVIAFIAATFLQNGAWLLRSLTVGTLAITIALQLGLAAFCTYPFVPVVVGAVGQEDFLRQKVSYYDDRQWANTHLPPDSRILSLDLHPYFFDVPYTYGAAAYSGVIDYRNLRNPSELLDRLQALEITHIAIPGGDIISYMASLSAKLWPQTDLGTIAENLVAMEHLVEIYHNPRARIVRSRTFGWAETGEYYIYEVRYDPSAGP